jgi:hypothetical protein
VGQTFPPGVHHIKSLADRTSRIHPQLSAAAHFHGLVDYNKTAFSPPGCKIIAHKKPGKRSTWEPHGQHGYSLGPEMNHYRCQNVYISVTDSERIVDTLVFPPPQLSDATVVFHRNIDYGGQRHDRCFTKPPSGGAIHSRRK